MKTEIIDADQAPAPVDASTVIVIRDALASDAPANSAPPSSASASSAPASNAAESALPGLEVLMLQRNSRGVFGGMWVFPGGQVDNADRADAAAHDVVGDCEPPHGPADPLPPTQLGFRTAAMRETMEEAGIDLGNSDLVHLSHWLPPPIRPKRFATHFFVCQAPDPLAEITVDQSEIVDHIWISPTEALRRRSLGGFEFVTPTFVTLTHLAQFGSAAEAVESIALQRARCYHTEMIQAPTDDPGMVAVYPGDAAYPSGDLNTAGPRRRCYMLDSGWAWEERD